MTRIEFRGVGVCMCVCARPPECGTEIGIERERSSCRLEAAHHLLIRNTEEPMISKFSLEVQVLMKV